MKLSGKFVQCTRCSNSYHSDELCIPAGAEVLSRNFCVCPEHNEEIVAEFGTPIVPQPKTKILKSKPVKKNSMICSESSTIFSNPSTDISENSSKSASPGAVVAIKDSSNHSSEFSTSEKACTSEGASTLEGASTSEGTSASEKPSTSEGASTSSESLEFTAVCENISNSAQDTANSATVGENTLNSLALEPSANEGASVSSKQSIVANRKKSKADGQANFKNVDFCFSCGERKQK